MVMDTGSSLTWLQCEPCTVSCHPQVGPVFDPSASKTYRKLLCKTPECESSTPYKFTPMLTDPNNPSLYFLKLTSITVAGKPLAVNPSSYRVPTILDSGTVITRVPSAIYTALQAAVVKAMSGKYPQAPAYSILETCFKGKLSDVAAAAPAVGLVFQGGSILDVKAGNLLVDVAEEGISCLGFARSRSISIIGNRQQQTVNVAYDVGNSRIGFAPGGCR
ncbi:Aspartyl protease family protein At5g10770 [Linum perenne]